jgi:hypothetical protein
MAYTRHSFIAAVAAAFVSLPAAAQQAVPVPAAAEPAAAAILTQVQGNVLVDAGKGFVPVSNNVGLKLGDRVMVAKDGGALLSYSENCSFPLESPSMTTVAEGGCTTATQGNDNGNGLVVGAFGGALIPTIVAIGAGAFDEDQDSTSP